ncbi:MAG TPA: acetylxylan esterase [Candidatus Paceibacterota bacterium]|nr:acetylxylan esterase [Candidatus Paceibacterota bacterium]
MIRGIDPVSECLYHGFMNIQPARTFPSVFAIGIGVMVFLMSTAVSLRSAVVFPPSSELPDRPELPDLLVAFDGKRIRTPDQWREKRRPELKALFQHYMYGWLPPAPLRLTYTLERMDRNCLGGKATQKEIIIRFDPPGTPAIHLLLVVPNRRPGPAPVVLGLNFCGNHTVLNDPSIALPNGWVPSWCKGCTNNQASESGRGQALDDWSIERSIDRGYAIATFYNGDVDPDRPDFTDGVHPFYAQPGQPRGSQDWGCLAAWAWGLHRAVDYLVTDEDIQPRRIAVFGHSRNGKTALLAGAMDERIGLILSHQAGCGGTAPSRGKIGESVRQINDRFPHWFNDEFKKFNDQTSRLPFDQHGLIALCAPRPVLLSNATEDTWANPAGQFEMLQAANPVYRLLKVEGLRTQQMPETGRLVDSRLGYFIRPGKHSTTPEDWKAFLDFADRHWGKPMDAPGRTLHP